MLARDLLKWCTVWSVERRMAERRGQLEVTVRRQAVDADAAADAAADADAAAAAAAAATAAAAAAAAAAEFAAVEDTGAGRRHRRRADGVQRLQRRVRVVRRRRTDHRRRRRRRRLPQAKQQLG